ncbi:MAG: bifunctional adenosylcobinamide kinase/adenosylcobinamide-phosphate guanylyltransferase [Fervidobacterium sp.]
MILITGGIKSGKSNFALQLARKFRRRAFLATGVPFDEEMEKRIKKHKQERGNDFETYEESLEVPKVLKIIENNYDVIVFDCLTTYLGNLMHYNVEIQTYINDLIDTLSTLKCESVIITNETGWGIIPDNKLARQYVEILGKINSQIANLSREVYLMISGIGVKLK